MNVKNIAEWRNKISTIHKNSESVHHKMKKNDQKSHYTKYQLRDDYEYKKIIITKNMKKFSIERNVLMINAENIIRKNKKHDKNLKSQNIMWKKKNITDISIYKIQKKQKCAFNHNAWISK